MVNLNKRSYRCPWKIYLPFRTPLKTLKEKLNCHYCCQLYQRVMSKQIYVLAWRPSSQRIYGTDVYFFNIFGKRSTEISIFIVAIGFQEEAITQLAIFTSYFRFIVGHRWQSVAVATQTRFIRWLKCRLHCTEHIICQD